MYKKLNNYFSEVNFLNNFCVKTIIFSSCMFFRNINLFGMFNDRIYFSLLFTVFFKFFCFSTINEFFLTTNHSNLKKFTFFSFSYLISEIFGFSFLIVDFYYFIPNISRDQILITDEIKNKFISNGFLLQNPKEYSDDCSICLEKLDYLNNDKSQELDVDKDYQYFYHDCYQDYYGCGKYFHTNCIFKWLLQMDNPSHTCPNCRMVIPFIDL